MIYKLFQKIVLTFVYTNVIIQTVKKDILTNTVASARKELHMEDMNSSELLVKVSEENQTRKILEILHESKDLEEATKKVKALLNK